MPELANATDVLVEFEKVLTDIKGLGRQRMATVTVTGLSENNPEFSFTPGNVALKRLDCALVIPVGAYCQGYWNGSQANPKIHFDLFPDQESFSFQLMVWGTSA